MGALAVGGDGAAEPLGHARATQARKIPACHAAGLMGSEPLRDQSRMAPAVDDQIRQFLIFTVVLANFPAGGRVDRGSHVQRVARSLLRAPGRIRDARRAAAALMTDEGDGYLSLPPDLLLCQYSLQTDVRAPPLPRSARWRRARLPARQRNPPPAGAY